MMILEMFLKKILDSPQLKAEPVVENFLKLDDKVAFEKLKAGYVKTQKIVPFKTVKNSKGNVSLKFDTKTNNFLFRAQRHFSQMQPSIKGQYSTKVGYTKSIKMLPPHYKHVVKHFAEYHRSVKLLIKFSEIFENKISLDIVQITFSPC